MADRIWPTTTSLMVHTVDAMEADCTPSNAGAVSLKCERGGIETFSLTIFTDDAALSIELAAVINGTLAKHNKLIGQNVKVAA